MIITQFKIFENEICGSDIYKYKNNNNNNWKQKSPSTHTHKLSRNFPSIQNK